MRTYVRGREGSANAIFWRGIEAATGSGPKLRRERPRSFPWTQHSLWSACTGTSETVATSELPCGTSSGYITEAVPTLEDVATVASLLAERKSR
jgi:hypothetical protein